MNIRSALTALAGTILGASFAAADLLSYWPLDETEGEIAVDVVGTNDAVWQNPGAYLAWTAGRVGGAAELNDAGGNNYFQINGTSTTSGSPSRERRRSGPTPFKQAPV